MSPDTSAPPARAPRSSTHYALRIDGSAHAATAGGRSPPTPLPPPAHIGDVLGSYRLVEMVGRGSMGSVFRAEHVVLRREVALKVLHVQHARRRDAVARLYQEARAASQMHHRNIVEVVDYLEIDHDTICLAMEYLPGQSLGQLMRTPAALPPPRALDILAQIADGLDAAHAAGIVHRDLKPDNVVVVSTPGEPDLVKIVDFGLCKLHDDLEDPDGPRTAAGQVFGTPPYFSPEQATGLGVDGRADIYSLGAIAYEMFTGRPPFTAASFGEYVFKHASAAPVPPGQVDGNRVPDRAVEALVLRCLEKDPDARPASAAALAGELRAVAGDLAGGFRLVRRAGWSLAAIAIAALLGAVIGAARGGGDRAAAAGEPDPVTATSAPEAPPSIVRLQSRPPAQVFRRGRKGRLCETPCALAISPGADRAARAVFVMRRRGYHDQEVAVDTAAPPDKVTVRLERQRELRRVRARGRLAPDATLNPYRDGID